MNLPIIGGDPNESISYGTKIRGILEHEVDFLKEKSKDDYDLIKNTINLWLWKDNETHLADLQAVLIDNQKRRIASNKNGMNKTKTFGAGITLPTGLLMAIEKVRPNTFKDKKELNKFKKWFPQFKTYDSQKSRFNN